MLFIGLSVFVSAHAQEPRVDTVAVMILDRMASVIGDLNSCSFTLKTSVDVNDPDYGLIKKIETDEVYILGPDKMHILLDGEKGRRGFWYNGQSAIIYYFGENNYAVIDAPEGIIAMIDSIHENYGFEFPAADFFYPTFTDDMLNFFDDIMFLGSRELNGRDCLLILARNEDMSAQIWFSADAFTLPQKFVIVYKNDGNRQYEADFSNWQMNPDLPPASFDFLPPPGAHQVDILPQTNK